MKEDNKIETKNFYKSQKIEILSNRLFITKKSWFKYLEYDIMFDEIIINKTVRKELNRDFIAIGFLILLIGIIFNFVDLTVVFTTLSLISLLFIIIGLVTKRSNIEINNYSNDPIIMSFNKKTEQKTRSFAERIIEITKDYLINKYSRIDKDLPIEQQINSIDFLRNRDLIDDKKYNELKDKLIGRNIDKKPIGFE